jgi:hypothetical protein
MNDAATYYELLEKTMALMVKHGVTEVEFGDMKVKRPLVIAPPAKEERPKMPASLDEMIEGDDGFKAFERGGLPLGSSR